MEENDIQFLKKIKILNESKEVSLFEIKLLYVFNKSYNNNILIVTNDDKAFAYGDNKYGVLGLGHQNSERELTINEELSDREIIDFKSSKYHSIARSIDGKIYCWGFNDFGVLGNGKKDSEIYKPKLNEYLSDKSIVDICCGERHSLALTNRGDVYAWGWNYFGQIGNGRSGLNEYQSIPLKVNDFNGEKLVMISCGEWHSMALTEGGRVFSWGRNDCGQLGLNNNNVNKPSIILISNQSLIKKISCGQRHSLLLSSDGDIYWFGFNGIEEQKRPQKLTINTNEIVDIESRDEYNILIAFSKNGIYYIWGKCGESEKLKVPKKTKLKSFNEIFFHYYGITFNTLNFTKNSIDLCLINGKYEREFIEECLIGWGAFSTVHKAFNRNDKKFYAIKKIPLEDLEYTSKEVNILFKLKGDFVVKLINCWVENNYFRNNTESLLYEGIYYSHPVFDQNKALFSHIQMELGFKTLEEILDGELEELLMTPLGYYISSELFIELLECVQYIHKQNIIHRNLQPINILITYGLDGRFIKLCSFCFSTFHEYDDQSHTQCMGTLKYMAPEVIRCRKYDTKADIYSLGVIAGELFDLDINKQNVKQAKSKLEMKFSSLKKLYSSMISTQKQLRPSCDQILSEKESWTLNSIEIREAVLKQFKSLPKQSFLYLFVKTKVKREKEIHVTKGNKFKSINNFTHYLNKTFKVLGIDFEQNINSEEMLIESESEEKVEKITETLKAFKNLNRRPQLESNLPTNWHIAKHNSRNKTELDEFVCGSSINRYKSDFKELNFIGSGGFGKVYKVLNRLDQQQYAIKIITFEGKSEEIKRKSFAELEVMAKLKSDHIVQYKNSWLENDEILCLQMELCFDTLKGILERKRNEFKRKESELLNEIEYFISSELFTELLECVNYIHKHNPPIIHRDLKPSNILITDGKNQRFVKLGDFGLATIHFDGQTHTEGLGSVRYVSPEVMRGRDYDTKADIYSLGFIAEELFGIDICSSSIMTKCMTISNSLLKDKYKNVIKCITQMVSAQSKQRPTCEQLINKKSLWALNMTEMKEDIINEVLSGFTVTEHSIEQNFCKYFIKTKSQK